MMATALNRGEVCNLLEASTKLPAVHQRQAEALVRSTRPAHHHTPAERSGELTGVVGGGWVRLATLHDESMVQKSNSNWHQIPNVEGFVKWRYKDSPYRLIADLDERRDHWRCLFTSVYGPDTCPALRRATDALAPLTGPTTRSRSFATSSSSSGDGGRRPRR